MPPATPIKTLRPLADFVDPFDTPLAQFIGLGDLAPPIDPFESIFVADASTYLSGDSFVLTADFCLNGVSGLHLPGLNQLSIAINDDGLAEGRLVCGPVPSLVLDKLEIDLVIDPAILNDGHGGPAKISAECGLRFDEEGFHLGDFTGATLHNATIGQTGITINLDGIAFAPDPETFLTIHAGQVTLPMFAGAAGTPLELDGEDLSFGRAGPSGRFSKAAGPPIELKLHDFGCRIADASLTLDHGQLVEAELKGKLDLSAFLADDAQDGWIDAAFHVGPHGIGATLAADGALVELAVRGAFTLTVSTIRLDAPRGGEAVLWLSGLLTPDIEGVGGSWPEFAFDEIGITAKGEIRLAEGASIATTQPFSVDWQFAKLTITAFSLQRPDGGGEGDLELRLSAGVELVQGIPAGASVEGLVVTRLKGNDPHVRFDGIGVHFATPGAFDVAVKASWDSANHRFSGSGYLELPSIDMRLDVVFTAERKDGIPTLFVAAETSLPGGVPIGATGLSLYDVSGLLAFNKEIDLNGYKGPRRYFDRFNDNPKGFTDPAKWSARKDASALGLGVVLGTGDDGWAFSCRGALILTFPDITLLAAATGDLLEARKPMNTCGGKLTALLAVIPAEQLMRFDFSALWSQGDLFEVSGEGGAEFHFDRPLDFLVWAGKPPAEGKPISARALRMDKDFLLSTDYWFSIDSRRSAKIGMSTGIEWRFGFGVYVELTAHVSGAVTLAWNPAQLEGDFGIDGRARLTAGGLSLGIDVRSTPSLMIAQPKELKIPLKACIEINLGFKSFDLCLGATIAWVDHEPPHLPDFVHGLSAVPRFWNPGLEGDATAPHGTGIVQKVSEADEVDISLGTIQPHSELVLEFSKSMGLKLVAPIPEISDAAVPCPQSIGTRSNWSAAWSLTKLVLENVTEGRDAPLFGTFQRSPVARNTPGGTVSPRPPNTDLRLLSSRRYGQDGSIGGGGVDQAPNPDCSTKPDRAQICVSLAGLATGSGLLVNGWAYEWRINEGADPRTRSNIHGVILASEDVLIIFPPTSIDQFSIIHQAYDAHDAPIGQAFDSVYPVPPQVAAVYGNEHIYTCLCWEELRVDTGDGADQGWGGSSGTEEWNVDNRARLLVPDRDYLLHVEASAQLLEGTNQRGRRAFTRTYSFHTARAPDWEGALQNAVAAHYPDDGMRPVFLHYDLRLRLHDDFFEALYALDNRTLGIRVRSANGEVLHGPLGEVLLPVAWEAGSVMQSPNEQWWREAQLGQPGNLCEPAPPTPERPTKPVLPIALADLPLLPLERYTAELVAIDAGTDSLHPTSALATWSFTTSAFPTWTTLAAAPARIPVRALAAPSPLSGEFDDMVRTLGATVVALAQEMAITPVRLNDSLAYVLIESPEPLDDDLDRLGVEIAGTRAGLAFNLDRTRCIASLSPQIALDDLAPTVEVRLNWQSDPVGVQPEQRRTIRGQVQAESAAWQVPLEGLF